MIKVPRHRGHLRISTHRSLSWVSRNRTFRTRISTFSSLFSIDNSRKACKSYLHIVTVLPVDACCQTRKGVAAAKIARYPHGKRQPLQDRRINGVAVEKAIW